MSEIKLPPPEQSKMTTPKFTTLADLNIMAARAAQNGKPYSQWMLDVARAHITQQPKPHIKLKVVK